MNMNIVVIPTSEQDLDLPEGQFGGFKERVLRHAHLDIRSQKV
jgi:hypothetical protein